LLLLGLGLLGGLLLRLLVRLLLLTSAAHGTRSSSDCGASPGIASNSANRCATSGSPCRSLRPTPLLFGSFGGWCCRSSGIDAGLLLRSQIARILVLRLLLGSLIVLWIYKEADLSGGSSCRGRRCLSICGSHILSGDVPGNENDGETSNCNEMSFHFLCPPRFVSRSWPITLWRG